jgi:hypothetical protein
MFRFTTRWKNLERFYPIVAAAAEDSRGPVFSAMAHSPRVFEFECWIFPEVCGLKLEVSAARQGQEAAA